MMFTRSMHCFFFFLQLCMNDVDRFVIQTARGKKSSLFHYCDGLRPCGVLHYVACFFCRCCFNVFLILFYTLVRERLFFASALLLHRLFFFWCFEVSSLNMKAAQQSCSYSTSYRRMPTGEILYICMHMCSFFFPLAFPDFFSFFFACFTRRR